MNRSFDRGENAQRAIIWIVVFAVMGVALALLYADADQQDSGYHFLFARWAHLHPHYFVGVWARPLFTLLYFIPAQFGYTAAKLFTVIISLATAWQTFRLARQIKLDRAELAIPFLFLQPSFFLLCSTIFTETLFALIFVVALRLHLAGRVKSGMLAASLLILVRPEGFFIGVLWGVWVLRGTRFDSKLRLCAALQISILGSGILLWGIAAYAVTRDPLWIIHDWPPDWNALSRTNGTGTLWRYILLSPLIVGPLLIPPFAAGLRRSLKHREFTTGASAFLILFIAHSLMFWRGWFGSAGYARYLVCVSPAIALITLVGWNQFAERRARYFNVARAPAPAVVIATSFLICAVYVDGWRFTRDARAIEAMHNWFVNNQRPVSRLICSQAYMRILFDRDQWEKPGFTNNRDFNLDLIRRSPKGTLVFWDNDTGPKWYGLRAEEIESAGYVRLRSQTFRFEGIFLKLAWDRFGGPRYQQMHLLYKE
jgi:hypothetical protein